MVLKDLGFRVLVLRDLGFRVLVLRDLGFRVYRVRVLWFREVGKPLVLPLPLSGGLRGLKLGDEELELPNRVAWAHPRKVVLAEAGT